MTEEIIIDGINVGECEHSFEQECEELKKTIKLQNEMQMEVCEEKNEEIEKLKTENEKLKKIIDEAKNSNIDLKSFLVGEAIQNEYEQQLDQFKQTLAEIKKIAEQISLPMGTGKSSNRVILANQILQKINEVE